MNAGSSSSWRPGRRTIAAGVTGLVGIIVVGLLSVSSLGATPITGSGTNIAWAPGTPATTTGSGAFECGTTATLTMDFGSFNSGATFPQDWSTPLATNDAFVGGITPAGAIAILTAPGGNSVTVDFSYELVDPIVLVNFIDTGVEADFGSYPITLIDSYSTLGSPSVVGNTIELSGGGTENEGWAVQVTGSFGPTSGPLTIIFSSPSGDTSGFSVAVPSGTACAPPTPEPEPEPTPARFTG